MCCAVARASWSRQGGGGELEALLTDLSVLEAKADAGLAFDLADDFAAALRQMPSERLAVPILGLLGEALRRDLHFIDRHPSCLFQCLWNSGWWYDCPDAALHYEAPERGWPPEGRAAGPLPR